MKVTQSWTQSNCDVRVDSSIVTVTETVELTDREMERVINKVATGTFFQSASERAAWEKLKEIGTLVEYKESCEGHTIKEVRR